MITVSIVSHGHSALLGPLLEDIACCLQVSRVLITLNVPESHPPIPKSLGARTAIHTNPTPRGFGANHNMAFQRSNTDLFCVLNPDIRLLGNPFLELTKNLEAKVALTAPAVLDPQQHIENSVRHFPRLWNLLVKALGGPDGRYDYDLNAEPFEPEWVAGMFMLVRSQDFAAMEGFDEGFFLYYEDVDLYTRLWQAGRAVRVCPRTQVVHDARRTSHKDPRYMIWHLQSMLRYILKHLGRLPAVPPR